MYSLFRIAGGTAACLLLVLTLVSAPLAGTVTLFYYLDWDDTLRRAVMLTPLVRMRLVATAVLEVEHQEEVEHLVERLSPEYGLDPALVRAVVRAESNFNPDAVSPKGAEGLMQIMPATQQDVGCGNAFDPEQNLRAGMQYLKMMLDKYGDVSLALAAYNAGPGAVDKYGGVPPYKETQAYVQKVLRLAGLAG